MGTLFHYLCTRNVYRVPNCCNMLPLLSMLQEMFYTFHVIHAIAHIRLRHANVSSLVCATLFGMLNLINICRILQCQSSQTNMDFILQFSNRMSISLSPLHSSIMGLIDLSGGAVYRVVGQMGRLACDALLACQAVAAG